MQISEGPVFPDPKTGVSKILQLKNGNTMYMQIHFDTAWNIHVYEAQYRVKTETDFEPAFGRLKSAKIEGIFEINGDAIVMVSESGESGLSLYRLIIDGVTGKLKDEKQVISRRMNTLKKGDSKSQPIPQPEVFVRKDPGSENYAVTVTNGFVSDSSKRVEFILFGSDHKETKRVYNSSQFEKFKYLRFIDMNVLGPDKIVAFIYGYNLKEREMKEGELIYAGFDTESKTVDIKVLDYSNDLVIESGITRYDPKTKRILMLSIAQVNSESGKLSAYLGFIDPAIKRLLTNSKMPGEKLSKKFTEVFGKGLAYNGMPQNLFINDNGTITVLFEEIENMKEKNIAGQTVRNIAVATFDHEVDLKSSYFIPMDHFISDMSLPSFYQSQREYTGQQFLKDNQYKTGLYISDGHNSFVVLNDPELNNQSAKDNMIRFKDLKEADAFYYQLVVKEIVPKRKYVFGKPADNYSHKTGVFTVYDYDRLNNLLVVLKTEKEGPHPGIKLVWLQP